MGKKSILLVDDSIAISRLLKKIVEDSGEFEIVGQGKDGVEGIKLYASLKPDIVVMDLVMPEMDGIQAIRSIISLDPKARIVVISSAGGVGDKALEALRFGAKSVISKPFEPEKVIETLRGV
jgi:two-component system chemotaxis response regulator CheY